MGERYHFCKNTKGKRTHERDLRSANNVCQWQVFSILVNYEIFSNNLEHAWLKGEKYKIMMVYKQGTFQVVRSLKLSSEYQAMFFKQEMNDQDERGRRTHDFSWENLKIRKELKITRRYLFLVFPSHYKQVSNRILSMACVFRIWKSLPESKRDVWWWWSSSSSSW